MIIVGHYPIFESDEITVKMLPYGIKSLQDTILHYGNVIAVISGHHNIDDEYINNKVYNISVQSLDKTNEYKKIYIDYNNENNKTFVKTRIYSVE